MKITLLAIGKTSVPEIRRLTAGYLERLSHYVDFELVELPDVRSSGGREAQKRAEGENLLKRLKAADAVVLLDERGEELTSGEFASRMGRRMASGLKRLVFIIGGPFGFAQEVYDRADKLLSLSRMTFTHEMVRLFFVEQLYRAMTILRGESYHHD